MSSSELEADPGDIEMAFQTASLEDLRAENTTSTCMRLPSLKHRALLEGQSEKEDSIHNSDTKDALQESRDGCDRCKEKDLIVCFMVWSAFLDSLILT
jgi:hypothetical protein